MTSTGKVNNTIVALRGEGQDTLRLRGQEHAAQMQAKNDKIEAPRAGSDVEVTLGTPHAEAVTYTAKTVSPLIADAPGQFLEPSFGFDVLEFTAAPESQPLVDEPTLARTEEGFSQPTGFSSLLYDPSGALPTPLTVVSPLVSDQGELELRSGGVNNGQFNITLGQGSSITTTYQNSNPASNDSVLVEGSGRLAIDTRIINNAKSEIILGEGAKVTYNYIYGPDNGQDTMRVADNGSISIEADYINNSRNLMIIGDGAEVTFNFRINPDNADDAITVRDNGNLAIDLKYVNNSNTVFTVGANAKVTINGQVDLDNADDTITVANNGNLSLKTDYVDNHDYLYQFGAGQEVSLGGQGVYDNVESSLMVTGEERMTITSRFRDNGATALTLAGTASPVAVSGRSNAAGKQDDTNSEVIPAVSESQGNNDLSPAMDTTLPAEQKLKEPLMAAGPGNQTNLSIGNNLFSLFHNRNRTDLAYLTGLSDNPRSQAWHSQDNAAKASELAAQLKGIGRFDIEI